MKTWYSWMLPYDKELLKKFIAQNSMNKPLSFVHIFLVNFHNVEFFKLFSLTCQAYVEYFLSHLWKSMNIRTYLVRHLSFRKILYDSNSSKLLPMIAWPLQTRNISVKMMQKTIKLPTSSNLKDCLVSLSADRLLWCLDEENNCNKLWIKLAKFWFTRIFIYTSHTFKYLE